MLLHDASPCTRRPEASQAQPAHLDAAPVLAQHVRTHRQQRLVAGAAPQRLHHLPRRIRLAGLVVGDQLRDALPHLVAAKVAGALQQREHDVHIPLRVVGGGARRRRLRQCRVSCCMRKHAHAETVACACINNACMSAVLAGGCQQQAASQPAQPLPRSPARPGAPARLAQTSPPGWRS